MWKLLMGNPWVTIALIIALMGAGAAGGTYITALRKNQEISEMKIAESHLQAVLAQNLIEAQAKARDTEEALNAEKALKEKEWQDRQHELETQHGKDADALATLRQKGGGNKLSRDAVVAWLRIHPEVANNDGHVPSTPGDPGTAPAGGPTCTESDLLADRNNWKSAYDTCHNQLTLCKSTLKDWHDLINGGKK